MSSKSFNQEKTSHYMAPGFLMIAALFLALSPLFHGLHLTSCNHAREFCHPGHTLCAYLCSHGHECDYEGAGSQRTVISNSQVSGSHSHEPSTCPICQTFAQLVKGHWLSPPQAVISPQKIQIEEHGQDQTFPDQPSFLNGYPRAPPVC
jgi:hypothetical protein